MKREEFVLCYQGHCNRRLSIGICSGQWCQSTLTLSYDVVHSTALYAQAYTPITIKPFITKVITACCMGRDMHDPGILPGSVSCVSLGDMYLEADLSRKPQGFMSEMMSILRYDAGHRQTRIFGG